MNPQAVRVQRYYEANTGWMLARGSGRGEAVIHRPLWLPGVSGRRQAVHSVDALIRDTLAKARPRRPAGEPLRLLDLGCGAGGTAVWLSEHLPATVTGVTISPTQVRRAQELAHTRGAAERCRFVEGDFLSEHALSALDPEAGESTFDAVYAVEAFSHAASPELFLQQAAARLSPGGLLILCDDFPVREPRSDRRGRRWIEAFRRGWQLGPLPGAEGTVAAAREQGLELLERRDLSPFLRGRVLLERATWALLRLLPAAGPRLSSRRGGAALQICLRKGWIRYLFLVFRKD